MIFARKIDAPLTSLVKKLDSATVENKKARMGSFVVMLSDEDGLEKKLKDLAEKEKLEKIALTIDTPTGPPAYHIAKDADVTVLLYVEKTVKVNRAFKKGELNDAAIASILSELPKIVEEK